MGPAVCTAIFAPARLTPSATPPSRSRGSAGIRSRHRTKPSSTKPRTTSMRAADLARLSERYPDGGDAGTRGPTRILGVETPIWDDLGERIFADFVTDPPYGIGWWAPHP